MFFTMKEVQLRRREDQCLDPAREPKNDINFKRIERRKPANYWTRPDTLMMDCGQAKKVRLEDG